LTGLAEQRNNGPSICCWNERVDGVGITKDSLNEGIDGSRVAVVEADGDRKDLIGGCGRKGYAQGSTYRIGVTQMVEEETKELNNEDTKGRPGKTREVYVILAQLRETDIKT